MKEGAKKRLKALAGGSKRSNPFLAAEAITGHIKADEWQMADANKGKVVSHGRVSKWLRSWGKPSEGQAPR